MAGCRKEDHPCPFYPQPLQVPPLSVIADLERVVRGEHAEHLNPWIEEIPPEKLFYFDPQGRFSDIYYPKDLAAIIKILSHEYQLAFLLVGGAARNILLENPMTTDLDYMLVNLNPQNPVNSVSDIINSGRRGWHLTPTRWAETPLLGTFTVWDGRLNLAILGLHDDPQKIPTSLKIFQTYPASKGEQGGDWLEVWPHTIADTVILPQRFEQNPLSWAYHQPREDSAMILLLPQNNGNFPFRAWLIDPYGARAALGEIGEIQYHSLESLLPPGERDLSWVLATAQKILRGVNLSVSLDKSVPTELFFQAVEQIREAAEALPAVKPEEELIVALALEQNHWLVEKMMDKNCRQTLAFLLHPPVCRLFPRLEIVIEKGISIKRRTLQTIYGVATAVTEHEDFANFFESKADYYRTRKRRKPFDVWTKDLEHHTLRFFASTLATPASLVPEKSLGAWVDLTSSEKKQASDEARRLSKCFRAIFYLALTDALEEDAREDARIVPFLGADGWPAKSLAAFLHTRFALFYRNIFNPLDHLGQFPGRLIQGSAQTRIVDRPLS